MNANSAAINELKDPASASLGDVSFTGQKSRLRLRVEQIFHNNGLDEPLKSFTPLQLAADLYGQIERGSSPHDPAQLRRAMQEILSIPSEKHKLDQIMQFSKQISSRFPDLWRFPLHTGGPIADYLESELLPKLRADDRALVEKQLSLVRNERYGVNTLCTIYTRDAILKSTWPRSQGVYVSGYTRTQRNLYGLGVMAIRFCDRFGPSCIHSNTVLTLDLLASWNDPEQVDA